MATEGAGGEGKEVAKNKQRARDGGLGGAAAACIIASNAKVCHVMSKRVTRPPPPLRHHKIFIQFFYILQFCTDVLHLPHLAHVLRPYGTLRLSLQFCAPLVFLHSLSLSLFL